MDCQWWRDGKWFVGVWARWRPRFVAVRFATVCIILTGADMWHLQWAKTFQPPGAQPMLHAHVPSLNLGFFGAPLVAALCFLQCIRVLANDWGHERADVYRQKGFPAKVAKFPFFSFLSLVGHRAAPGAPKHWPRHHVTTENGYQWVPPFVGAFFFLWGPKMDQEL